MEDLSGDIKKGFTDINSFCKYVLSGEFNGYTVIFHNLSGFDGVFIQKWLKDNSKRDYKVSKLSRSGTKVSRMEINKVRFIDSLSFFKAPLSKLPKMFGLKNVAKGWFPHHLNRDFNDIFVAPPKIHWGYQVHQKGFDEWYSKLTSWDNQAELVKYCIQDVVVLKKACARFREICLEVYGEDPWQYTTIPSFTHNVFRIKYNINECQMAITPMDWLQHREMSFNWYADQRSSLSGGRVNCIVTHWGTTTPELLVEFNKLPRKLRDSLDPHHAKDPKSPLIKKHLPAMAYYYDMCSLYPYINKYGTYPVGFPMEYKAQDSLEKDIKELFGVNAKLSLVTVDITPPKDLYLPLLHSKDGDGKLVFSCHPIFEKTFTSLEITKAISLGYVVTKIYRALVWKKSTVGMFSDFVNAGIKLKAENSGFPRIDNESESEYQARLDKHIADFMRDEGVQLDREKITHNPGMRALGKFFLNNLWGRFGMDTNFPIVEMLHGNNMKDQQRLRVFMRQEGSSIDVKNLICGRDTIEIRYKKRNPTYCHAPQNDICVPIAVFTTAQARLKLYSHIESFHQQQVLYFDTDSIIFWYDPRNHYHNFVTDIGESLGKMTNELSQQDGFNAITEFYSLGPKTYLYELSGKSGSNIKFKGVCASKKKGLKYDFRERTTPDTILTSEEIFKALAVGESLDVYAPQPGMVKSLKDFSIRWNYNLTKIIRNSASKRWYSDRGTKSLPWGHKDIPVEHRKLLVYKNPTIDLSIDEKLDQFLKKNGLFKNNNYRFLQRYNRNHPIQKWKELLRKVLLECSKVQPQLKTLIPQVQNRPYSVLDDLILFLNSRKTSKRKRKHR